MLDALMEIFLAEPDNPRGRIETDWRPVSAADRNPHSARHLVGEFVECERRNHGDHPLRDFLRGLRECVRGINRCVGVPVESTRDPLDLAGLHRTRDRFRGYSGAAKFPSTQKGAALEQARQAITLVRGVNGHVTIPMEKLEYVRGFVTWVFPG